MAWTTQPTVAPGQVISAAGFGNVTRDNINYLHSGQPVVQVVYTGGADFTTSSASWADVDATNLSISLTLTTGRAVVDAYFTLSADNTAGSAALVDVRVDSATRAGHVDYGLARVGQNSTRHVHVTAVFTGLTAGLHTFRVVWRNLTGGAGATISAVGSPVVMVAREV